MVTSLKRFCNPAEHDSVELLPQETAVVALTGSDPSWTGFQVLSEHIPPEPASWACTSVSYPKLVHAFSPPFPCCPLGGVPVTTEMAHHLFFAKPTKCGGEREQFQPSWGWIAGGGGEGEGVQLRLWQESYRLPMPSAQHGQHPPVPRPGDMQWVASPPPAQARGLWLLLPYFRGPESCPEDIWLFSDHFVSLISWFRILVFPCCCASSPCSEAGGSEVGWMFFLHGAVAFLRWGRAGGIKVPTHPSTAGGWDFSSGMLQLFPQMDLCLSTVCLVASDKDQTHELDLKAEFFFSFFFFSPSQKVNVWEWGGKANYLGLWKIAFW